jgi:hypothetical protein
MGYGVKFIPQYNENKSSMKSTTYKKRSKKVKIIKINLTRHSSLTANTRFASLLSAV